MILENSSIQALVKLIDDPDDSVFEHVRGKLIQFGPDAIPYLEQSWENDYYGLIFQTRIENIIQDIQFEVIKNQLLEWTTSSEKDLLEGAIIIAKFQYPDLDDSQIYNSIQAIRKDIWLELNDNQTAYEQVKIFNRIFFGMHHFQGDTKNYYSPVNSCINVVMESKKGNPLVISLIYSIIAQKLDLPIYGVNLPNHFILAYMDDKGTGFLSNTQNEYGVLFYINAFSKGSVFDATEIKSFLDELKLSYERTFFEPCSNTSIIMRMINNLIASYQQIGNAEKVEALIRLKEILD